MSDKSQKRFKVTIEEGLPHGDLYELEQTTYFRIVDTQTNKVVMTFQCDMEASLSSSSGQWDDYHYSGAREVVISANGQSVEVTYYGGRQESFQLPQ